MLRTYLLVPKVICRRLVSTISTNIQTSSSPSSTKQQQQLPQITVALCIQRYVHLSPEMTKLEKDYSNLITQLEAENSYLSDHELRHKTETELAKQRHNSPTSAATSINIVETVVDKEDRFVKELESFHFMSRETEDDKSNNIRSHNRKLEQNLLLIVQRKNIQLNKDEWIFPEKTYDGEPSLRVTAEQIASSCGNLVVQISGNTPLAWYKNTADPLSKKIFFFKAEYLAGAVKQFATLKSTLYKDHAWITHEDLPKYLSSSYYKAVKDMLFVF